MGLVWVELPRAFTQIAQRLNCSFNATAVPAICRPKTQQDITLLGARERCEGAKDIIVKPFGATAASADELIQHQIETHTQEVLSALQSKPPPLGIYDGLQAMLHSAQDKEFRRRADVLFNALV